MNERPRHRVTNWTLQKNKSTDRKSDVLEFPDWNVNGICQVPRIPHTYEVTSLPQLLKNSGYHTIHCGKAHWGAINTSGDNLHHFGFEVNIAGHAADGLASYLGDLMDWLEQHEMADNTILIFMSDNRELSSEAHWRDTPLHIHNAPLNSGKGSIYEGGIREPMIVKWTGKVQPNTQCDDYLIIEDFFPTLLDMAQVSCRQTKQPIDGLSFMPMLSGEKNLNKNRSLYWHFPNLWGNDGPGIGTMSAVRKGDWKLVYYYETGEKHNLAAKHPELAKALSMDLGAHLRSVNVQRPTFKTTGKVCPWPDEISNQ